MPDVAEAIDLLGLQIDTQSGRRQRVVRMPGDFKNMAFNAETFEDGIPGLHRYDGPEYSRLVHEKKDENGWHRMAAICILAGKTNKEIAEAAKVHPSTVSNLRQQRWFQQLLTQLAGDTHQDIQGILRSEALATVEKLVSLRDTANSEKVQLEASKVLLEQANGKPTQQIISQTVKTSYESEQAEMDAIQTELEQLRARRAKSIPI